MAAIEQFEVDSESSPSTHYVVSHMEDGSWQCGCIGWTRHVPRRDCKHIQWVQRFGGRPIDPLLAAVGKAQRRAAR